MHHWRLRHYYVVVKLNISVCVCLCVCLSVCLSVMKRDSCPQFESPEPLLIPVGFEIPISFQGRNLDIYMVRSDKSAHYLMVNILIFIIYGQDCSLFCK